MMLKIGFTAERPETKEEDIGHTVPQQRPVPRKSVVQVRFPGRAATMAYYNDRFDLRCGDIVFVDGKLEGQRGRVEEVNYNFKIKLSDYKRVIAVADTDVHGKLFLAGSHLVTFNPTVLPLGKAESWYMAPQEEDEEYASGSDDTTFRLEGLKGFKIGADIADRGHAYYMENRVAYLCLERNKGYAIVVGSRPYKVEFNYMNGEISGLVCSCFCSYNCKHEFAAMLQLRETLDLIEKNYADEYEMTNYFAAISKSALISFVLDGKESGSLTL